MFLPEIKSEPSEDISILIKLDNHSDFYLCECGQASRLTVKDCQQTTAIPVHFSRRYSLEEIASLKREFETAFQGKET